MVEKAKTRLRNKKNISFHIKKIDSLPFNNNFADAILVNQVLHHLPDNSELFWIEHRKVFKEFDYNIIEIPKLEIKKRANFIIKNL